MGNAASGLPYEVCDEVEPYSGNMHWTMHTGYRKDDSKEEKDKVAVFKFSKSQSDKLAAAQRNWQKLRTLRHPYVLSFIDGVELEDSIMVVTEDVIPLEVWINEHESLLNTASNTDEIESVTQEIVWGFKCILDALSFLHGNCKLVHGYTGLHSCFISKNGDWKLGAMDLACNIHDETEFFRGNEHLLGKPFRSPERVGEKWITAYPKGMSLNPGAMDVYSLAQVIQHSFQAVHINVPDAIQPLLKAMLKPTPKARISCTQLQEAEAFSSEYIQLMASLGELALKPAQECIDILGKLTSRAGGIPKAVCTHKILPSMGRALATASTDFQNRDLREASRQTVQSALALLSQLSEQQKIEETHFNARVAPSLTALWSISDRVVRTALLKNLKPIVPLLSSDMINKKIFEPLLAGFADSNYKMREESLKSLIPLVDRLQEKQLQDQLVRCVCNLQADPEAAIRTNATIFIGKIASKMNPNVRTKTLATSFTKAMKDAFVPCRVAGLRATLACLSSNCFEATQVATKLMPQVCLLLLDGSQEIRELAVVCMTECMAAIHVHHKRLVEVEAKEKEKESLKERQRSREDRSSDGTAPSAGISSSSSSRQVAELKSHIGVLPAHGGGGGGGGGTAGTTAGGAGNAGVFGAWSSLSFSWAVDGLAKSLTNADGSVASDVKPLDGRMDTPSHEVEEVRQKDAMKVVDAPLSADSSFKPTTVLKKSKEKSIVSATSISQVKAAASSAKPIKSKSDSAMKDGWDSDLDLDEDLEKQLGDMDTSDFDLDLEAELNAMDLSDFSGTSSTPKKTALSSSSTAVKASSTTRKTTATATKKPVKAEKISAPPISVTKMRMDEDDDFFSSDLRPSTSSPLSNPGTASKSTSNISRDKEKPVKKSRAVPSPASAPGAVDEAGKKGKKKVGITKMAVKAGEWDDF
mmetsp:Transcript_10613/g.10688  ORF Transcript_10613/g.10688 Transcript_10613/m.10688 type:complete len:926 (+) Transcript_10613:164-2941(+)